jgi:hypothetical protein
VLSTTTPTGDPHGQQLNKNVKQKNSRFILFEELATRTTTTTDGSHPINEEEKTFTS